MPLLPNLIRTALVLLIVAVAPGAAIASPRASASELAEWQRCAKEASTDFDVPLIVLTLIYEMEGGLLGKETTNRAADGTVSSYDIGPMQINSQHLGRLSGFGITREMLRDSMCVNVHVAAYLVRDLMTRHDRIADVVAAYHSPSPKYQARYLERATRIVERRMAEIAEQGSR